MKAIISLLTAILMVSSAQTIRAQGPGPGDLGAMPQAIGEAGIDWYVTWDNAKAESRRSGRPIFFMSAAATCSGIPGVF